MRLVTSERALVQCQHERQRNAALLRSQTSLSNVQEFPEHAINAALLGKNVTEHSQLVQRAQVDEGNVLTGRL